METNKEFTFEKPKLPLMFVKECLDAVLKRDGELSNLIADWDGKLDSEEIDYLFSWLDKSGLIERDEKTVKIIVPREKYIAFCEQFFPFSSIQWGIDYEKMVPLSFYGKRKAVKSVYEVGFASINLIIEGYPGGLYSAGRTIMWLQFKGFIGPTENSNCWKSLITDEQYAELSADNFAALDTLGQGDGGVSAEIQKKTLDCIRKNGCVNIPLLERELKISLPLAQNIITWLECSHYVLYNDGSYDIILTDEQYKEFLNEYCSDDVESVVGLSSDEKNAAVKCILKNHFASVTLLRNTLNVNFLRATQLLCWLENEGYIAPSESEYHKVLLTDEQYISFNQSKKSFEENFEDDSEEIK